MAVIEDILDEPDESEETEWTGVNSASGWVTGCRWTDSGLAVQFKDGAVCTYPDTTIEDYHALATAGSAGQWVHANLYGKSYI